LLANVLGWLTARFVKLGYELTELTNQLFAVLGMRLGELAN